MRSKTAVSYFNFINVARIIPDVSDIPNDGRRARNIGIRQQGIRLGTRRPVDNPDILVAAAEEETLLVRSHGTIQIIP